jgi:hypothetical protein
MESRDSRRIDNVVVSWCETNQTSDTPVARISNDGGQTFGPILRLATNGTISSTTAGERDCSATETQNTFLFSLAFF